MWTVPCNFHHCMQVASPPNYNVMPVYGPRQMESGFVTQRSLAVKKVCRVKVVKVTVKRVVKPFFTVDCCMLHCRTGNLSCWFSCTPNERHSTFIRLSFGGCSLAATFLFTPVMCLSEQPIPLVDSRRPATTLFSAAATQTLHTTVSCLYFIHSIFRNCDISATGGKTWKLK